MNTKHDQQNKNLEVEHLKEFSSFRDPSGFLFNQKETLYRQINHKYQSHYDHLMNSGLYHTLVEQGLMIPHQEVTNFPAPDPELAYKIIQPQIVNFISYPYEWTLIQMRGAALTTLRIALIALDYGMILKDASAYNMQFHQGRWMLIDTLSFELYNEGEPWIAYKQFCQHFLGPMALMAYFDNRLGLMSRLFIDGIPLDIAARLLPFRTKLRFGLLTHIHIHAKTQKRYADKRISKETKEGKVSKKALIGLITSLRQSIKNLSDRTNSTEWEDYYQSTNYSENAFENKKAIVKAYIEQAKPENVFDLGANTGEFSRLASEKGIFTVAFDIDPGAVTKNYIKARQERDTQLLPLIMDLTNPSPGLGWGHQERKALISRGPVDLVLALALVHHLAISNNVPFEKMASLFRKIGTYLIIEFIPKSDSQVKRLLQTRKDIFPNYSPGVFENAFIKDFEIIDKQKVTETARTIYFMRVREK